MFRVFWLAIKDLLDELFVLMAINALWLVLSLPLAVIGLLSVLQGAIPFGIVMILLSVLPGGPATRGLYSVAERIIDGRTASIRDFFAGMRSDWLLSWKVYGLWTFGLILIIVNMGFYFQWGNTIGLFLGVLFLYLLAIWLGMLIYIGPLLLLQTDKRIRLIARNALLMTMGRPVFTLVTLVLMLLLLGLSLLVRIAPFLLTFALLALWGFRATLKLIKDAEERRAAQEAKAAEAVDPRANTEQGRGGQIRPPR